MNRRTRQAPHPAQGQQEKADHPAEKKFHRYKRVRNFWEVIFQPDARPITHKYDWNLTNTTGIKNCICDAASLSQKIKAANAQRWQIKQFSFINCDFIGHFPENLSFRECRFESCDFGYTTWKNVKFSNCKFKKTSLTLSTFEQCQFVDCTWENISISGTETKIFDTVIDNPENFITAAKTNLNPDTLKQFGAAPAFQTMRLEETKLKMARTILLCNERHGDDSTYYKSIKTYLMQGITTAKARASYKISSKDNRLLNSAKYCLNSLEGYMLMVSGAINGWGSNLSLPAIVGVLIALSYATIYRILGFQCDFSESLMAAFDITMLIGYTKQATENSTWIEQIIYGSNALLGLWWYAIFVPTVINRISRVR
ncbi:pentapeptide repeat-containing protein [Pseudomonas stutzeri]|nr:pentapeptide repeat-containing protein [Stutzerimonas degradans]